MCTVHSYIGTFYDIYFDNGARAFCFFPKYMIVVNKLNHGHHSQVQPVVVPIAILSSDGSR
jgi:hypothetical protein